MGVYKQDVAAEGETIVRRWGAIWLSMELYGDSGIWSRISGSGYKMCAERKEKGIVHRPEGRLSVVFIRGKNCFVDVYYVEGQRTGAHHPFSVSNGTVYSSGHAVYGVYGGANGKPGHSKKGQYKAKGR